MATRKQKAPEAAPPSPGPSALAAGWAAPASLLLAAALAYANSLGGAFLFDDLVSVVDNPSIRSLRSPLAVMTAPGGATRPLVALSLAANYAISGLHPWSYHLFNILVHGLAAVTLFVFLRRALPRAIPSWGRPEAGGRAALVAWAAALFWLVHPLQTQAVDYVIQRAESMMGLFFLATLACVARAVEPGRGPRDGRRWQAAAVAACWLGVACKQVAAVAPVLALLYDRNFASGEFRAALRRRPGMYLGMFASYVLVPVGLALTARAAVTMTGLGGITPWEYLRSQFGVICHYLRLSIWPAGLCFDYAWPVARRWQEIGPQALLVVGLGGATCWALAPARGPRSRAWGFLGAWFLLILAPSSSILPIADLAAEQRMYLSLAAVAVAAALGLLWLCQRTGRAGLFPVAVAAVAGVLAFLTIRRTADYRSAAAMWQDTALKRPGNIRAAYSLGCALEGENRYADALVWFRRAGRIESGWAEIHLKIGHALDVVQRQGGGKPDPAVDAEMEREYLEALRIKPEFDTALFNLGLLRLDAGRLREARGPLEALIRVRPDYPAAHYSLAAVLALGGRLEP